METLEGETDNTAEVDVEVVDGNIDVTVLSIALGLSRVPGLRVRGNSGVTLAVVLLEGDSEVGGTRVSNVKVRALVLGEVGASTGHLSVESIVSIRRGDGELVAFVFESHALVTTVPVAHGVGVGVGEPVDDEASSSSITGCRDSGGRTRVGRSGWRNELSRVATVECHGAKRSGTSEAREKDGGKLGSVETWELAEGNGVELLRAVELPAQILGGGIERLGLGRVAVVGRVKLDVERGALGSRDAERNAVVSLGLGVNTAELAVEVRASLGNKLNTVLGWLSNGDRGHGAIVGGGEPHGVVEQESQTGLGNPVIDYQGGAGASGSGDGDGLHGSASRARRGGVASRRAAPESNLADLPCGA